MLHGCSRESYMRTQEMKITGATTFVNPFKDEEAEEAKKEEEERIKVQPASWACARSSLDDSPNSLLRGVHSFAWCMRHDLSCSCPLLMHCLTV